MKKLHIIIVDDHTLFRGGLKLLLQTFDFIDRIDEAPNGKEFLHLIRKQPADIVLMDINMPAMDGIEATRQALEIFPDLKIIALSMFGEEEYYYKMIEAGVKGFLLKDSEIDQVKSAIQTVWNGDSYFSQELLYNVVKNISKGQHIDKDMDNLSDRELEILYYICKGLSNQEIADELCISKRTVDKHRAHIIAKTQTRNTAHLVMYSIKNKLVDL